MAHLVFYRDYDHDLGEVSVGRWREVQKLLPPFIEYINRSIKLEWKPGTRRNVAFYEDGSVHPAEPCDSQPPACDPFIQDTFLRDESDGTSSIYFDDAAELLRLFKWYDFLDARDGAASLYLPLVDVLRSCTRGIENFA